jgi:hypothetical protein
MPRSDSGIPAVNRQTILLFKERIEKHGLRFQPAPDPALEIEAEVSHRNETQGIIAT